MKSDIFPGVLSALVVTLPLFLIWFFNQRFTSAFREGLNSIHTKENTKTVFRPAPVYFIICFFLAASTLAIGMRFFISDNPLYVVGIICLLPAIGFGFTLFLLFNSKIIIKDKCFDYNSGLSRSVIEFSKVLDVSSGGGLLIFCLENNKKKAVPLMFYDARSLGQSIKKELYELAFIP